MRWAWPRRWDSSCSPRAPRVSATPCDIAIQAEQFALTKKEMNKLNAEFTGQPLEKIEEDADRDKWFTAEAAKEYGFVDHVITRA